MKREPKTLADRTFDLVVVGGGVYGLATAWDAATRGLSVAVLEKSDFGGASSSATLKLIHGGLRYLQHLDLRRMRISIGERRRMLYMAPHLVHPLAFIMPCYGHGMRGPEIMRMALLANDILSADRNFGQDPQKRLPAGRILSAGETRERLPGLRAEGLVGGALFYDAQMVNSERLTLAFGLSAAQAGAALLNYAEVTGFRRNGRRLTAARVRDAVSGETFEVAGRFFLNMTGPWSDITAGLTRTEAPPRRVLRSKGVQLITRALSRDVAFSVESHQADTTALIKRGGRNYFITPWRGRSILGTTDVLYEGDPDRFAITEKDVADFLAELNAIYPAAQLRRDEVTFWVGGMRPVGDADTDPAVAKASHRYQIHDHEKEDGLENLFSVIGVKYTICRHIARTVLDRIARKARWSCGPCGTDRARLAGGEIEDYAGFLDGALRDRSYDEAITRHLVTSYGSAMPELLKLAHGNPYWARPVAGSTEVLRAEIVHAVREEMAVHLPDVVLRRTDLGSAGYPGRPALEDAAALMAAELDWSEARMNEELAAAEALYRLPPE